MAIFTLTFKLILMIPVKIDALLNCTDEKISIRSENNLWMFVTSEESMRLGVYDDQLDL